MQPWHGDGCQVERCGALAAGIDIASDERIEFITEVKHDRRTEICEVISLQHGFGHAASEGIHLWAKVIQESVGGPSSDQHNLGHRCSIEEKSHCCARANGVGAGLIRTVAGIGAQLLCSGANEINHGLGANDCPFPETKHVGCWFGVGVIRQDALNHCCPPANRAKDVIVSALLCAACHLLAILLITKSDSDLLGLGQEWTRVWNNSVLVIPELKVTKGNGLGLARLLYLKVFAAAHCKEECPKGKVCQSPEEYLPTGLGCGVHVPEVAASDCLLSLLGCILGLEGPQLLLD